MRYYQSESRERERERAKKRGKVMFFLKHSTLLRIENLKEYVKNVKKKYLTHELERANLKIVILKSHFLFSQMSFSG